MSESLFRVPPAAIQGGEPTAPQLAPEDDYESWQIARLTGWWPALGPADPGGWLVSVVGPAGPVSTRWFAAHEEAEAEVGRLWREARRAARAAELADRLPRLLPDELRAAAARGDLTAVQAAADRCLDAGDQDGYLWLMAAVASADGAGPLRHPLGDGRVAWLNLPADPDAAVPWDLRDLGLAIVDPARSVAIRHVGGWFAAGAGGPAERVVWVGDPVHCPGPAGPERGELTLGELTRVAADEVIVRGRGWARTLPVAEFAGANRGRCLGAGPAGLDLEDTHLAVERCVAELAGRASPARPRG